MPCTLILLCKHTQNLDPHTMVDSTVKVGAVEECYKTFPPKMTRAPGTSQPFRLK